MQKSHNVIIKKSSFLKEHVDIEEAINKIGK